MRNTRDAEEIRSSLKVSAVPGCLSAESALWSSENAAQGSVRTKPRLLLRETERAGAAETFYLRDRVKKRHAKMRNTRDAEEIRSSLKVSAVPGCLSAESALWSSENAAQGSVRTKPRLLLRETERAGAAET
ncbi:unnamed protein product [Coccothraustes coccothraustes]